MIGQFIFMRGIPACGKTTLARNIAKMYPRTAIVSKDSIRETMFPFERYQDVNLYLIQDVRNRMVEELRKRQIDRVVFDETLIEIEDFQNALALVQPMEETVLVDFTNIPFSVCVERDRNREKSLGVDVLLDFYQRMQQANERLDEITAPITARLIVESDKRDPNIQTWANNHEGLPFSPRTRVSH